MFDSPDTTLLVTEFHHRVMNSFQVIHSLANRCGRVRDVADLPPVLDELSERLSAFAALHRQLAAPPDRCFATHCSAVGASLVAAFGRRDAIRVTMEPMDLLPDRASRIALIVAELVTNCLKHSLASAARGWIRIDLRGCGDRVLLHVQDSAAAQVPHHPPEASHIVSALAASLRGEACVIDRDGYCVRVSVPMGSGAAGAVYLDRQGGADPRNLTVAASGLPSAPFRSLVAQGAVA